MRVTLRADAGPAIGAGHLVRCTALAEEALAGGDQALVVTEELPGALAEIVAATGVPWRARRGERATPDDALSTRQAQPDADWIVVDGYAFGSDFQALVAAGGARVMVFDDHMARQRFDCAALVNPSGEALTGAYRRAAAGADLLLGPRYAALRRAVRETRRPAREGAEPTRVLITMGASDPGDHAAAVLSMLEELDLELAVRLLSGPLDSRRRGPAATASARPRVEILAATAAVGEQMAWADLAISAGGSTCWELACLGVPMALVQTAANQRWVIETLVGGGAAIRLDSLDDAERLRPLLVGPEPRRRMGDRGRALVDGRGAERLLEYCREREG